MSISISISVSISVSVSVSAVSIGDIISIMYMLICLCNSIIINLILCILVFGLLPISLNITIIRFSIITRICIMGGECSISIVVVIELSVACMGIYSTIINCNTAIICVIVVVIVVGY